LLVANGRIITQTAAHPGDDVEELPRRSLKIFVTSRRVTDKEQRNDHSTANVIEIRLSPNEGFTFCG